jgi:uncharacterized membrane protein YqiK
MVLLLLLIVVPLYLVVRAIPNDSVGVVEKLWSAKGSVPDGQIIALRGEAGFQAELLRGGLHFTYPRWQYRIHKHKLVTIRQGRIGYVYARDGEALPASQTLARVVDCNHFQDARRFLLGNRQGMSPCGQRGRQRAILREGVYAINPALFVVITEEHVHCLSEGFLKSEAAQLKQWVEMLKLAQGFSPVVVGGALMATDALHPELQQPVDSLAIVTVHDGPSIDPGEIIAPTVATKPGDARDHNNFQDPEAFLAAGGRRGRQYQPLTDGTYFLNHWFATAQMIPKTVVPIGYVGVVVSYYGKAGQDLSGASFRHGERVSEGERGVWERPLGPGKYAFNTYAGSIVLVPTTNFVLHWITGKSETHRYDESLRSIDLVTRDAPAPPVGRGAHRLPAGPERDPAVRRCEEADHPDARPHVERLLPRHCPQKDHARTAARPRHHPAGSPRGAAAEVPRVRHGMRGRTDWQARRRGGRHEDQRPARAVANPPVVD